MKEELFSFTLYGAFSALCWMIVGIGATLAVYSPRVKDTTLERCGLAAVAIACIASAWHAITQDYARAPAGLLTSGALAFYVIALLLKHNRKEPPKLPNDKTRPGDLPDADS